MGNLFYNALRVKLDIINSIPDVSFKFYYLLNYSWKNNHGNFKYFSLKKKYFEVNIGKEHEDLRTRYFNIDVFGEKDKEGNPEKIDKKIAIANIKVDYDNMERSILQKPNIKRSRRKTVFQLLNEADRLESDLIVFPETSIPYSWLRLLAERSHKRYMGIVAGLEHWINKENFAFNFMVTILPFKVRDYKTSIIKLRLKNHYSHDEKHILKGYRLIIPNETVTGYKMSYDLFHWKKTYFSIYNCFELADIFHRSIFKSKVDFIVASEYNRDTNYFSDIAGAWVRDVHSYFIQVNSSHFGDSRLIQPSKSYLKDLIQVKGGINSIVLAGNLEVEKLRKFQFVEYHIQKDWIENNKYDFKPTPPDFNKENVKRRINDESFIVKKKNEL